MYPHARTEADQSQTQSWRHQAISGARLAFVLICQGKPNAYRREHDGN
jgi:hypothetical protein